MMHLKQNPIILTCLIMLFASSFIFGFNTVQALTYTPSTCTNAAPCINFDNSRYPNNNYFLDHAMNIQVNFATDPGLQSVSVQIHPQSDATGCTFTFSRVSGSNTVYALSTTYIYLTTGTKDCINKPYVKVTGSSDVIHATVLATTNDTGLQSNAYGSLPAIGPQPNLSAQPATCTISAHPSDGICDSWKRTGTIADGGKYGLEIPYGNNGAIYKWYCTLNSDPLNPCPINYTTPDIYMEVDYMSGHKPDAAALQNIVTAFALNHTRLHILVDEDVKYHTDSTAPPSLGNADNTAWDNIKKVYFGTAAERSSGSSAYISDLLTAKRFVFHYILITHSQPGGYSGTSENPGNDIDITLGSQSGGGGNGAPDQQAGTMMHELGHNLNLQHYGGGDTTMCKPNFLSVMNYLYQFSTLLPSQRPLNYSGDSNDLTNPISEDNGVPTTYLSASQAPYVLYGSSTGAYATSKSGSQAGKSCIDWDKSGGTCGGNDNSPDIAFVSAISGCPTTTTYPLHGFNDWTHMTIDLWHPQEPSSMQDGGHDIPLPIGGQCPNDQIWFADTKSCRSFGAGIDTYWFFIIVLVIIIGILAGLHAKPPKFFTKSKAIP